MNGTEQLWGVKEVAAYLGVPVQTVYQWRTTRLRPCWGTCWALRAVSPGGRARLGRRSP